MEVFQAFEMFTNFMLPKRENFRSPLGGPPACKKKGAESVSSFYFLALTARVKGFVATTRE
jgi:hypothetical protein